MNTIIVIAEQRDEFTLFSSHFSHLPVHFSWNKSMPDAMDNLELEQPFILFAVSRKKELLLEWLTTYDSSKFQIPLVAFTGSVDWADREMFWKTGVSDIVELPRSRKELEYIIRAFLIQPGGKQPDTAVEIQGQLRDMNVLDIIRSFTSGKKSGTVIVSENTAKGQLEFNKGKLVNASLAECDPVEAVMVMSLWKEGHFSGQFDKGQHKERILLDTKQVIEECLTYKTAYKEYLKKLPDWDLALFTDPDLEYMEFGPKDREILQKFRNGLSLSRFMEGYEGSWNFIFKKFILWLDRKWILKEDDYRLLQAKVKADARKSAFRKVLDKMFSKKEEELFSAETEPKETAEEDDSILKAPRMESLFNQPELLERFLASEEVLLEIPIVMLDDQEEELFLPETDFTAVGEDPEFSFHKYNFSETRHAFLYRIKKLDQTADCSAYDLLFTKVPFIFILFSRETDTVRSVMHRLQKRYETPLFFLSSAPVENEIETDLQKELREIQEKSLILYDSLGQDKVVQALKDAVSRYLNPV